MEGNVDTTGSEGRDERPELVSASGLRTHLAILLSGDAIRETITH